MPDGLALVDFDLKIRWANPAFRAWCRGEVVGRGFYDALGSPEISGPDYCPFQSALQPRAFRASGSTTAPVALSACLVCRDGRYIDLHVTPLDGRAAEPLLLVLARDVSRSVEQQHKLDALHKAGQELAALAPEQLAEMSVAERIELMKLNIRRFTRDLLHYKVIEIRVIDPQTGQLKLLLQEGMASDASERILYPAPEGNGVTGYVAATGKAYLCSDTRLDPLYLPGSPGAQLRDGAAHSSGSGHRHVQCGKPRGESFQRRRFAIRRDIQPRDRRRPAHA